MPGYLNQPVTGRARLVVVGCLAVFSALVFTSFWNPLPLTPREERLPAPYRTPKFPGGLALRMAMVHDVIHERYLRHGFAWYEKRAADSQQSIALEKTKGAGATPAMLDALDDLAVALDVLHRDPEAIVVCREKLALLHAPPLPGDPAPPRKTDELDDLEAYVRLLKLPPLSPEKHHEYTAHANLGTCLIHGSFGAALRGDPEARKNFAEGLAHIERAIEINPKAHFGRENWQALASRHMLAAFDRPDLMTTYSLIGQSLKNPLSVRSYHPYHHRNFTDPDRLSPERRYSQRALIGSIEIDPDWAELVHANVLRAPFDEPTLALMGMWMLGGGPNPHSALALGRIMETIGQNSIAWTAYQRALDMQERFSPDPDIKAALINFCTAHQHAIAEIASARNPGWEAAALRTHRDELAWGQACQKAYWDYEAAQIKAGVALDDPDFYAAFFKNRAPIASPTGTVDDFTVVHVQPRAAIDYLPTALLAGGVFAFLATFKRRKKEAQGSVSTPLNHFIA